MLRVPGLVAGSQAKSGYQPNNVSMFGQRHRQWPNIETILGQFIVLAGCSDAEQVPHINPMVFNDGPYFATLGQT